MSLTTGTPDDLREAFHELALAKPVPDAETLDQIIRLYPQHAAALTAFAIDLTIDALDGDDDTLPSPAQSTSISPEVSRAMSAYLNRVYELRQKNTGSAVDRAATSVVENPFLALDRRGMRALADEIGANPTFVSKLRDRIIDLQTMSLGFQELVARKLRTSLQALVNHLSAQSAVQPQGQFYKAEQKPVLGKKQSFEEAVRSSGLTDEQQHHLLSL